MARKAITDLILARCAQAVYETPDRAKAAVQATLSIPAEDVVFFDQDGAQALMVMAGDSVVLAFRGTEEAEDVLADLDARLVEETLIPGRVHAGFQRYVDALWPELREVLDPLPSFSRLYITGHSLGGAMAAIAAARAHHIQPGRSYQLARVVTFGAPRPGNELFGAILEDLPGYRYVRCGDGVPWLPPAHWGYRHAQPLRYIDRYGMIHRETPNWAWMIWDRVAEARALPWRWAKQKVAHHAMEGYIATLEGGQR